MCVFGLICNTANLKNGHDHTFYLYLQTKNCQITQTSITSQSPELTDLIATITFTLTQAPFLQGWSLYLLAKALWVSFSSIRAIYSQSAWSVSLPCQI